MGVHRAHSLFLALGALAEIFGAQLKILGAQLLLLEAPLPKED